MPAPQWVCERLRAERETPELDGWMDDSREYRRGLLRYPGPPSQQPARWLAAMRVIDAEHDLIDLEVNAEQARPTKR
jgi:hypothetical protein